MYIESVMGLRLILMLIYQNQGLISYTNNKVFIAFTLQQTDIVPSYLTFNVHGIIMLIEA